ncbi:MAG TPA: L,D-transpeptidase family protein [Rhizomicrobium sp.]|jgi:L,D-peptidoglycan transpeptidase YkuD (ErfK/YbiS/YcfS/YnhG family)
MEFRVRPDSSRGSVLDWGAGSRRCSIGRGGIAIKQREGDGVTPAGLWPLRSAFYRADRLAMPDTALPVQALSRTDGWCDAPSDPNYNRLVSLPYEASHENLWRQDRLYDIVVMIGFNDAPVLAGKGSAIFLHIAREGYAPTEGCVGLALPDLLDVLRVATPASVVHITN